MSAPRDSIIIGTAGHIDHGKTTLVRALTGVDCDRLDEEKRRGITIVLGFASLPLPDGRVAGIVDVPGHEKFVRTMVAGAGGVDVALVVVSAEEGVMPQTREHLEILKLLGVPELVVALTRSDCVEEDLLGLAELDVREVLESTPWPEAPVLPVSGLTGVGVDALRTVLIEAVERLEAREAGDVFRMPVDRSFSIRGFGTVVTGTTRDGELRGGTTLEVLPGRRAVRIRGLEVHGESRKQAAQGTRVALNLQGTDPSAVPPGCWLATPGALACGDRLDVALQLLETFPRPLENNSVVRFLCGTAEVLATVRLMDVDGGPAPEQVEPGSVALAQLALAESLGAVAGDRFVLRSESPMATLGGGTILDPEPPLLRRRERARAAELLAVLGSPESSPVDRVVALLRRQPAQALDLAALQRRLPPSMGSIQAAAESAVDAGHAVTLATSPASWAWAGVASTWILALQGYVDRHHLERPLLAGPSLAEARQSLTPPPQERLFDALVQSVCLEAGLVQRGHRLARPDHQPEPSDEARLVLDEVVQRLARGGAHPPPLQDALEGLRMPPDGISWLIDRGEIVRVTDDYLVEREAYRALVRKLVAHMQTRGVLSPGDFKSISGLTRRHAIPFLEFLDRQKITSRTPEGRALRDLPSWVVEP
ncbi:MAG: selenocysteine-specific translation elongation factor [Deltaproteobacteria bacterium]|nr:selenocysteine-specific translation elongation factor [Deltaproteobacteria bacterium]